MVSGSNFSFYFQITSQTYYYNTVSTDFTLPEQVIGYQCSYSPKGYLKTLVIFIMLKCILI